MYWSIHNFLLKTQEIQFSNPHYTVITMTVWTPHNFSQDSSIYKSGAVHSSSKGMLHLPMANSADPDQTAPEEQSDQCLHCLLTHFHSNVYTTCSTPHLGIRTKSILKEINAKLNLRVQMAIGRRQAWEIIFRIRNKWRSKFNPLGLVCKQRKRNRNYLRSVDWQWKYIYFQYLNSHRKRDYW